MKEGQPKDRYFEGKGPSTNGKALRVYDWKLTKEGKRKLTANVSRHNLNKKAT